jgi:copper resistance protein D
MVSAASFLLMSGSDLALKDVLTTNFFRADTFAILFAIGIGMAARHKGNKAKAAILLLSLWLIAAAVSTSHSAARIDHRVVMVILTATHHLGTAAWLGAMPYLLISLGRTESVQEARRLTQLYSRMALLGASALVLAGAGLAWSYVGSWRGVYGTTYRGPLVFWFLH